MNMGAIARVARKSTAHRRFQTIGATAMRLREMPHAPLHFPNVEFSPECMDRSHAFGFPAVHRDA